ncbi:hypothetical protein [Brevibacterium sp.]|uniref:hypothetical protein n=1 Tax=Brevibacterium sp. TaxID=1701 RepID=UPI002648D16B|nr:hypothetical protein [Brevibacterium sp.]MDN6133353.1 hypothetical protein [Brevibacterium sp.]MDN6190002.1 hypothetical protein [Brevibacterium sp.]MDN6603473.1 hypothetical protein [Brevibacterium sp.]MDN6665327.1 hypothetical protein [Brevibacterium sp.]
MLAVASICVFGQVAADPGGQVVADNDDSSLFIWWLGHAADLLASQLGFGTSGTSATADGYLYTEAMNTLNGGVNGAWNTSLAGLALLLAPVTWVAGPIVSYNLLIISTPVLVSLATAVLFTRFLTRIPAFVAAGGVGFSSYVIAQASGHPNLAFALTPPLVAVIILRLLLRGPRIGFASREFWTLSLGLGVVLGFQFYVSTEVLAGTFIAALCLLLALAVFGRKVSTVAGWLRLAVGGVIGSTIAALIALPLLLMMRGPNAPEGAIRPHGVWNTDLLDPIVPASPTLLGPGSSPIPRIMDIDSAELGAYVGVPALIAAAIIVICLIRNPKYGTILRIASAAGLLVFVLSLGSPVLLGGRILLDPGPFALIEAVPVLNNILPMRLVLHSTIALFAILGCGLQWALDHRRMRSAHALLGLLVIAAVCVIPGVQTSREVYAPEFYTNSLAEVIPAGSVVKTIPRPLAWAEPHADEAMVWQAVSGFHYRETGGYFIGSSPDATVTYAAPEDALDEILHDSVFTGAPLPEPDSDEAGAAFDDLREDGVDFIVLAPDAPLLPGGPGEYEDFLNACLGEPAFADEGVLVYPLNR